MASLHLTVSPLSDVAVCPFSSRLSVSLSLSLPLSHTYTHTQTHTQRLHVYECQRATKRTTRDKNWQNRMSVHCVQRFRTVLTKEKQLRGSDLGPTQINWCQTSKRCQLCRCSAHDVNENCTAARQDATVASVQILVPTFTVLLQNRCGCTGARVNHCFNGTLTPENVSNLQTAQQCVFTKKALEGHAHTYDSQPPPKITSTPLNTHRNLRISSIFEVTFCSFDVKTFGEILFPETAPNCSETLSS